MQTTINVWKKVFICLMAISATSAMAEWVEVASSDSVTRYVDFKTIRKQGNIRKVWELWDFKKRLKSGELSMTLRTEFDCKEETDRPLQMNGYSQKMSRGNVLKTVAFNGDEWNSRPPATLGAVTLDAVCNAP